MNQDILFFFDGRPIAQALYERLEAAVLSIESNARIKVGKTQISFANNAIFATVSFLPVRKAKDRPKDFLTVSFGLPALLDSPRIDAAVEPYPNRWTHHILISYPDEIDEELLAWIAEAAAFSASKRKA